jgi:hypothetical protein
MSGNQGSACHALKSTIVTLTSCDDAVFNIKDAFPNLAPMRCMVKMGLLILHVKLCCLSPLQHAIKSTIVTLTPCDDTPSFKFCVVSKTWSFNLPTRDKQLLDKARPGLRGRRTLFPAFAAMSLALSLHSACMEQSAGL